MVKHVNTRAFAILASLLLLGGAAFQRRSFLPPADAIPYQRQVRQAAATLPMKLGDWSGEDVPELHEVIQVLQPNVTVTRCFHNRNRRFWFVLVQCADSRTLAGHYPPVCYVDEGYTLISKTEMDWPLDHLKVTGMEYLFALDAFDPLTSVVVDNFMVLPDGRFCRDMDPVTADALNMRTRGFGAAEIQFVFEPDFTLAERNAIVADYLGAAKQVIAAIRSGPGGL